MGRLLLLVLLAGHSLGCRLGAEPAPRSGPVWPVWPVWIERRLAAMGTWFTLEVAAGDRAQALRASEEAVRAVEAVEARLSTWKEESELARLNRSPVGRPFELSAELARDLDQAARLCRETGGAFDPGLGALVQAWGLRTGGRRPTDDELARARAAGGLAGFELRGRTAVRLHPLAAFEEGGFGKGIGLDQALRALRASGASEAVLDLGGQLAVLGDGEHVHALADPDDRERAVLEVRITGGSLSTTGNSERGIVVDGVPRSHVLDPWSGEPADDPGSVSVWASDATTADCLSTGLYVLGPERALTWARAHPGVEVLALVRPEGRTGRLLARASAGWRGRLVALVPELEIQLADPDAGDPTPSPADPAPEEP